MSALSGRVEGAGSSGMNKSHSLSLASENREKRLPLPTGFLTEPAAGAAGRSMMPNFAVDNFRAFLLLPTQASKSNKMAVLLFINNKS